MNYIDTSVIVPALALRHAQHSRCRAAIESEAMTSTHALAESFAVLTGVFKYPNHIAAEALSDLADMITVKEVTRAIYLSVLRAARSRTITGGLIYDALHAEVARASEARKVFTYNISNFEHVAPDLLIVTP